MSSKIMEIDQDKLNTSLTMLYLCGCVLTGAKPQNSALSKTTLKQLYQVSRFHSLGAMVCEGLERMGFVPASAEETECFEYFREARGKTVRNTILLDHERKKLFDHLEQCGIWYMSMKGIILKELYPKIGLRQMADNDILFDAAQREAVRDWFSSRGYEVESFNAGSHDVYMKKPVYHYEMHVSLCNASCRTEWEAYYQNVKAHLVKDPENQYGYHFTDEDFYIYFFVHGFKHFDHNGMGVRFLLDLYVYLEKKQAAMDFDYIQKELRFLGLDVFEAYCRGLVWEVFRDIHSFAYQKLTMEQQELLVDFFASGTYGTLRHFAENCVNRQGRLRYMLERFFPGTEVLKYYHPIFRYPLLLPIGWVYRGCQLMASRPGEVISNIRVIVRAKMRRYHFEH